MARTVSEAFGRPAIPYAIRPQSKVYSLLALAGLLLVVIIFAATLGSVPIPFAATFQILLSELPSVSIAPSSVEVLGGQLSLEVVRTIILDIRLPRIVLAGLVGAALAIAGATYQGLFRNPLADPYLLGVASGAGLGATVAMLIPMALPWMAFGAVPVLAFVGAAGAVTVVYMLARVGKTLPATTLILAGVALAAFLSSITSYLMIISGKELVGIVFWLLGGLHLARWSEIWVVLPVVLAGFVVIWLHARPLNVMQLDEEQAQQLGINVQRVKITLLITATAITSAAICFTGPIGFVGIIVPHAVRLIWGPDHRWLLPLSMLVGAVFLIVADTLARSLIPPTGMPVGIITAFCGAPFFLYLLRRRKGLAFF
ncbi:MAG: iron chelate uptake ABC transporter family permease subunit [Dehalococcoidia bacterium]|nr:iron chelate uptake ABC transporter family permease subunit [Dehalococcoidia bacterium]